MSKGDTFPIGKITGVHGVRGEVRLRTFEGIEDFPWKSVLIMGDPPRPIAVEKARPHKKGFLLVLEGVSTRDDAERLVGSTLAVTRDQLPEAEPGEYYLADLMGMEVVTEDGRTLGSITGVITTAGNDVLEVRGPSEEVLIPAIEDVVLEVNTSEGKVVVRLIEGLLPEEK